MNPPEIKLNSIYTLAWWQVIGFPVLVFLYIIWGMSESPEGKERGFLILLLAMMALYVTFFIIAGNAKSLRKIQLNTALLTFLILLVPATIVLWDFMVTGTNLNTLVFLLAILLVSILIFPVALFAGFRRHPYNWQFIRDHYYLSSIPAIIITMMMFPGLIMVAIAVFILLALTRIYDGESVKKQRPDLLRSEQTISQVTQSLTHKPKSVWCGEIEDKPLYASVQDRAVIIGPPGTGKTVFLISQLLEWAKSRRPFVCLDVKPEIKEITQSQLEELGYRIITFNPTASGHRYNPLADLDSPESIGELASSLIPSDDAENAVFNESARDFLDAIITHLRTEGVPTLTQIWELIAEAESYQELLQTISESEDPDARSLANTLSSVSSNERLMGSIYATFKSNIRFLRYPAIRKALRSCDFTLAELLGPKPIAVFLQFEEKHNQLTGKLLSTMVGHIMRYLISHTQREPVLLLLDEIGTAPPINDLVKKLNTIRSRNIPTWMYWQSVEQMQRYGTKPDEGPNTILAACDFQMVFRLNDNATAEWMSKRIGTVDRLVENVTVRYGADFIPSRTYAQQLVQEPIVFPHQLQQLKDSEVICTYRGNAWRGYAKPYFKL